MAVFRVLRFVRKVRPRVPRRWFTCAHETGFWSEGTKRAKGEGTERGRPVKREGHPAGVEGDGRVGHARATPDAWRTWGAARAAAQLRAVGAPFCDPGQSPQERSSGQKKPLGEKAGKATETIAAAERLERRASSLCRHPSLRTPPSSPLKADAPLRPHRRGNAARLHPGERPFVPLLAGIHLGRDASGSAWHARNRAGQPAIILVVAQCQARRRDLADGWRASMARLEPCHPHRRCGTWQATQAWRHMRQASGLRAVHAERWPTRIWSTCPSRTTFGACARRSRSVPLTRQWAS